MRDLYMKNGQGFVLVYSITAQSTFNDLQDLREQILRVKVKEQMNILWIVGVYWSWGNGWLLLLICVCLQDADSVPMVLVGNKCDLEDERVVGKDQGSSLAHNFGCTFLETSAKAKINVNDVKFSKDLLI